MANTQIDREVHYYSQLKNLEYSLLPSEWTIRWKDNFVYFVSNGYKPLEQGWKIHVSCQASELSSILDSIIPIIIEEQISFKIVSSFETAIAINFGEAGKSQIGKIITIYPFNADQAYYFGARLDALWCNSNAPCPPSDLFYKEGGNVSLRFGAINNRFLIRDDQQISRPALIAPDGNQIADVYNFNGRQVDWAPALPHDMLPCSYHNEEKAFLTSIDNGRYHFLYSILIKSFSSVYFCFDTVSLKPVLIKIIHKRAGEDKNGYVLTDRAKNEIHIANILAKHELAPKVLNTHEDYRFFCSVSDYVSGSTFAALKKEYRIEKLTLLLQQLQKMHDLGIVHRDLKLTNIMESEGKLYFIDFELSGKIGDEKPYIGETPTYAPPEGPAASIHPSYDLFSLGNCIIHAYTGFEPGLMPRDPLKRIDISKFYIPVKTQELLKKLYSDNPYSRPTAEQCLDHIVTPSKRAVTVSKSYLEKISDKITVLTKQGLSALQESIVIDDKGAHWNSKHESDKENSKLGLNTGIGGTLLGFLAISKAATATSEYSSLIESVAAYIKYLNSTDGHAAGLFDGLAGAALAMGAVNQVFPKKDFLDLSYTMLRKAALMDNNYDFYGGYAGIAYVAMQIFESSHELRFLDIADHCIHMLIHDKECVDDVTVWKVNKADVKVHYETGMAHGTVGIGFVIAIYAVLKRSPYHLALAKDCFKEVFQNARDHEKGYLHQNLGRNRRKTINKSWCHGEAGYLWAIAQIPELFDDLNDEINAIISDCAKIPHLSNPTYCHGMAGSLEMWRLVNSSVLRNRITEKCYTNTLYELSSLNQTFGKYELFASEHSSVCSPDLWVGYTGSLSSLALANINSHATILKLQW